MPALAVAIHRPCTNSLASPRHATTCLTAPMLTPSHHRHVRIISSPQENMKGLLAELMEHHWEELQGVDYCELFANMRIRHEQNQVGGWCTLGCTAWLVAHPGLAATRLHSITCCSRASAPAYTRMPYIPPHRTALHPARSAKAMARQRTTGRLRKRSCWLGSAQRRQRSSGEDVSTLCCAVLWL